RCRTGAGVHGPRQPGSGGALPGRAAERCPAARTRVRGGVARLPHAALRLRRGDPRPRRLAGTPLPGGLTPCARRGRARGPGLLSPEAGAATGDGEEDAVKVVIADDEPLARERLRALLAARDDLVGVAEAGDGRAALQACAQPEPHLVLRDIAMPGIDGLEAARHLAAFEPRPAVVFCTAYDAHALSAFDAAAVDYLVKPVRAERLQDALERVRTFTAGLGRARE